MRPSAVTTSAAMRLSHTNPNLRSSQPLPLPSARPAMPVVETRPPVTARPCSCVAASNSPHVSAALGARDCVDRDRRRSASCRAGRRTTPASHDRGAGDAVTTAVDGDREVLLAREVHGGDDVVRGAAARDQRGLAVDHAVEDLAGVVVLRIARMDQLTRRIRTVRTVPPPWNSPQSPVGGAQVPTAVKGGSARGQANICSLP